jgi:hypothetical protein
VTDLLIWASVAGLVLLVTGLAFVTVCIGALLTIATTSLTRAIRGRQRQPPEP